MSHPILSNVGHTVVPTAGTSPADVAAGTRNSNAIDTRAYSSLVLVGHVGTAAGSPTSFQADFSLEESADGATGWTAVANSATPAGTVPAAVVRKNFDKALLTKAFIRVAEVVTLVGGTSPTLGVSSTVLLGGSQYPPA